MACWTAGGGIVGLGDLPLGTFEGGAHDVSADGSAVVGCSSSASGTEAFVWDAANGMRSLRDVLVNDFGVELTGWQLYDAEGVCADGLTIVGSGINPAGRVEG